MATAAGFGPNTLNALAGQVGARAPVRVRFGHGWLGRGTGWLAMDGGQLRLQGQVGGRRLDLAIPRHAIQRAERRLPERILLHVPRGHGETARLTWIDADARSIDRICAWLPDGVLKEPTLIRRWYAQQIGPYRRQAWLSYSLALLLVAVFVWQALDAGQVQSIAIPKLVAQGGNLAPLTLDGEAWRLLTAMLLHAGLDHLLGNLLALLVVAPYVERVYGRGGLLALFFGAGLAGSVVDLWFNFRIVCVGASGAVFALFAAVLAYALRRRGELPMRSIRILLISVGAYLLWQIKAGFDSVGTNNAVHVTGALTGLLCGLLIAPPLRAPLRELRQWASAAVVLAVVLSGVALLLPVARSTDNHRFMQVLEGLNARYEQVRQRCLSLLEVGQRAGQVAGTDYAQDCLQPIDALRTEVQALSPRDPDLLERQTRIGSSLSSYRTSFARSGLEVGGVARLVAFESHQERLRAQCAAALAAVGAADNREIAQRLRTQCVVPLTELEAGLAPLRLPDPDLERARTRLLELVRHQQQGHQALIEALEGNDVEGFNRAFEGLQASSAETEL